MKRRLFTLAILAIAAGSASTAFGQEPNKKAEKARENLKDAKTELVDAKNELKEAKLDSVSDYQKFKVESEKTIAEHNASIAKFRARLAAEKKENRIAYEAKLDKLEKRNSDLQLKLEGYKQKTEENWKAFKSEFSKDMDNLGKSIKDFTINKK